MVFIILVLGDLLATGYWLYPSSLARLCFFEECSSLIGKTDLIAIVRAMPWAKVKIVFREGFAKNKQSRPFKCVLTVALTLASFAWPPFDCDWHAKIQKWLRSLEQSHIYSPD